MSLLILVLVGLIVLPLITGWIGCNEMTIGFELNLLNSPFYKIGIFSERFFLPDNQVEDELIIGLFFVNIVFTFWKDNSLEDFNA